MARARRRQSVQGTPLHLKSRQSVQGAAFYSKIEEKRNELSQTADSYNISMQKNDQNVQGCTSTEIMHSVIRHVG